MTAAIPASSGKTVRHRLDRGGDRRPNRALHTIVLTRRRGDAATIAYIARRVSEGKSERDAVRCLKRYLARQLFRLLLHLLQVEQWRPGPWHAFVVSAETERARIEFGSAMRDSHNLIWIHSHSQTGQGRRHRQPTLNRAAVVLTAAAWQAYVQDTAEAVLSDLSVPAGDPGHPLYALIRAATRTALGRFNTPNARNTLALFDNVGFDPRGSWTFSVGVPPRMYSERDVREEIDGWLDVRHSIAHGSLLPSSALVSGATQYGPSLHRKDAERCIAFFEAVVAATAAAAHAQFP